MRLLLNHNSSEDIGEALTLDDPAAPFLQNATFQIHALGPVSTTYGYTPKLVPWLRSNLDRFDAVVVNGLWQYCGLAVLRAVAGVKPYLVFTHGMLDPYFKRRFPLKHLKKWPYWAFVEYWVLRKAFRVLFTTQAEQKLAEQSFWLHSWTPFIMPFGASTPPSDSSAMRESFHFVCEEARGRRFLLFLGRIHRKKGCDLLVRAFVKVAASDPDLHLVMAGPDQEKWSPTLQQIARDAEIAERVHWPGMLSGDAKWGAFYAAEAFVLPSHQENFGIAVAEALGCGKPVLLSDKINIASEISEAGCGLVETDTLAGTERLLQRWIDTPAELRHVMHTRALEIFQQRYNMTGNAETIIQLVEEAKDRATSVHPVKRRAKASARVQRSCD
jgi:glycosyltransferase involved in cell wall biosynthesis